jgi:uncharacterized membrane protein YfcA
LTANRLRALLIALLAGAAVTSVVQSKTGSQAFGALAFALFVGAVITYGIWRRRVFTERRARVFDREAKTDETGPRTDR